MGLTSPASSLSILHCPCACGGYGGLPMRRVIGIVTACVLVGSMGFSAGAVAAGQQSRPTPPQAKKDPASGPQEGASGEMQVARAQLQADINEQKRLQQQLKVDQQAKDRAAVERDRQDLKRVGDKIKDDQARIKQINSGRGR